MIKLIKPSIHYYQSFLQAETEILKEGLSFLPQEDALKNSTQSFVHYLTLVKQRETNRYQDTGKVPCHTFWLVDQKKFIGLLKIRYHLNSKLKKIGGHIAYKIRPSSRSCGYGTRMLFLGLKEAKGLGLKSVLLTCAVDNIASKKIIEKNKGVFLDEVEVAGYKNRLRFMIDTS